jgi:hypothetical protein
MVSGFDFAEEMLDPNLFRSRQLQYASTALSLFLLELLSVFVIDDYRFEAFIPSERHLAQSFSKRVQMMRRAFWHA